MNNKKKRLIIIGGGITGLSAGLSWCKNVPPGEHEVVLCEKEAKIGGYVTSYARKGYIFDVPQLIPDITSLLTYLDIDFPLKKFTGYYARLFLVNGAQKKAKIIPIPSGFDEFQTLLSKRYPQDTNAIHKFISHAQSLYKEFFYLKLEPSIFHLLQTPFLCPKIVLNSKKTFRQYVDSFQFVNQEIIEILDFFAAFSSLPSERVAAVLTLGAMNSAMAGTFRPYKGFISFPNELKKCFIKRGGIIKTNAEVVKIKIGGTRVRGVILADGTEIDADYVITTIDTKKAMNSLVGLDILKQANPSYAQKVETVKMSTSSFNIALGLDNNLDLQKLGFDCGYNLLTTGRGTFEKLFQEFDRNNIFYSDTCFHTAAICPSLTTGGKPTLTIRVIPMPMSNWMELRNHDYEKYTQKKEKIADFYIRQIEQYMIPHLTDHIVVKDIATPATYARYSGSPSGSIYDMAPYPDNFGLKRLKMRTPIQGLFQPKFSHSIFAAVLQGMQVVDMILDGKIMNGYTRYSPGRI